MVCKDKAPLKLFFMPKTWGGRKRNRTYRYFTVLIFLGIGTLLFFFLNICIGSIPVPFPDTVRMLAGQKGDETITKILSNYNAKPKITTIYKICKAFEISLAEFYNDTMFNTVAD